MSQKKLAVVTIETDAKDEFVGQLQYLFSDYLDIRGYSVREIIDKPIDADLILISSSIATGIVKPYLPQGVETIYIEIMFQKDRIRQLFDLPAGTKAMLVDYSHSTAIDVMSILHEIGVKHIDFKPVYLGISQADIPDIDLAVTAGLFSYVPSRAKEIIDIGWRKIGISTLMNIATKLKFLDPALEERLVAYTMEVVPARNGLTTILQASSQIKNQMEVVLEIIDDGIAVVDARNTIIHCNRNLFRILNISEQKLQGKNIFQLDIAASLIEGIFKTGVVENKLVEIEKTGRKLLVTRREILFQARRSGDVIIIRDVTQIEKLESRLREQLTQRGHVAKYHFDDVIAQSPVMLECLERARKVASKDATVLISGETGTGKELFAQSIHNYSARKNGPFIAINCAALPSNLLESELFGYEDGAFTGAKKGGKRGMFELAHTGTLFLDEVGDIPLDVQVKLLRVLEEREVMRIGGTNIIPVDVRILAATNREFRELVDKGKLRKDLYYRLNVLSLYLPPLRNRKSDIPLLIRQILSDIGCPGKVLDPELMTRLQEYNWDGNIRELKNAVEYMGYMGGSLLTVKDLPESLVKIPAARIEQVPFKELRRGEGEAAQAILTILKVRNAGRRLLHTLLLDQGFDISEHEVRKLMDYLQKKQLIKAGRGKKGAQLTPYGQSAAEGLPSHGQ